MADRNHVMRMTEHTDHSITIFNPDHFTVRQLRELRKSIAGVINHRQYENRQIKELAHANAELRARSK